MAKMNGQGLEALAVRRTTLADSDKVRYRVYRSTDDFVAVIAESALMAVKISGVRDPLRIVRDLPSEGVAIHAERMEKGDSGARVNFAVQKVEKDTQFALPKEELAVSAQGSFVPMQLGDLDQQRGRSIRILSPEDLEAMIGVVPPAPVAEALANPAPDEPEPMPESEPPAEAAASGEEGELTPEQVQALLSE